MEMLTIYLMVFLVGFILLMILTISGGMADVDAGDLDVGGGDVDIGGDVDAGGDIDVGHADVGDTGVDHGGVHGAGHAPNVLSLPMIFLFMVGFGGLGAIFEIMSFDPVTGGLLALAGGFLIGLVGFFGLVKLFSMVQSDATVKMSSLVGKQGTVHVPIKRGQEGQVMIITPSRGRFLVGAISDENIPNEAIVKVTEVIGDIVKVKRVKGPAGKVRVKAAGKGARDKGDGKGTKRPSKEK